MVGRMPVTPPARNDVLSHDSRLWWTVIGPGFAAIIGLFMLTAVYGAGGMSPLQRDLGFSDLQLLVSAVVPYLIAAAVAFPLGILLGRRYPTAVTLPAVVLMVVGVLLMAFVSGSVMLMVARALGGLGAGAVVGVTTALVRGMTDRRSLVAAVVAALGVLALVAAPFVSQLLSTTLSFRLAFLVAVPLLLVALVASAVSGIVLLVVTRRPAQPGPPGMQRLHPY